MSVFFFSPDWLVGAKKWVREQKCSLSDSIELLHVFLKCHYIKLNLELLYVMYLAQLMELALNPQTPKAKSMG